MTLWPPVFNTALPRIGYHFSTRHKDIPRSHQYFKAFFGHLQSSSLDCVFKLGLEVGNVDYIILSITGSRSMSGF